MVPVRHLGPTAGRRPSDRRQLVRRQGRQGREAAKRTLDDPGGGRTLAPPEGRRHPRTHLTGSSTGGRAAGVTPAPGAPRRHPLVTDRRISRRSLRSVTNRRADGAGEAPGTDSRSAPPEGRRQPDERQSYSKTRYPRSRSRVSTCSVCWSPRVSSWRRTSTSSTCRVGEIRSWATSSTFAPTELTSPR